MRREKIQETSLELLRETQLLLARAQAELRQRPWWRRWPKVQGDTNRNLSYLDPVVSRRSTSRPSDHSEPPAFVSRSTNVLTQGPRPSQEPPAG